MASAAREEAGPPVPPERRWAPAIAVATVLLVVTFGGYATGSALSTPQGESVTIAGVVRVRTLSGWELAERFGDPPGARLTRGSGSLDVLAVPFEGTDEDLVTVYVRQVLEPNAHRLSVSRTFERVRLASGLEGVRFAYVGLFGRGQAPIEGQVTVVVSASGVGVVFDGWAPEGMLQYVRDDVGSMIDAAEVV